MPYILKILNWQKNGTFFFELNGYLLLMRLKPMPSLTDQMSGDVRTDVRTGALLFYFFYQNMFMRRVRLIHEENYNVACPLNLYYLNLFHKSFKAIEWNGLYIFKQRKIKTRNFGRKLTLLTFHK